MRPRAVNPGVAWEPGFLRRAPWTAIFSIAGFVGCCVGLGFVLRQSDGKPIATWPQASRTVPVSVLLSLLVTFANLFLAMALSKGYEISWWVQALDGANIRKLEFDLNVQRGISALFSRHMKIDIFAIAAIVSLAVSVLDGPLIQKSSTITVKTYQPYNSEMQINVSNSSFPANFSSYSGSGDGLLTPLFRTVNLAYSNRDNLKLPIDGCETNTTCTMAVPAPGFDVNCTETRVPYNFGSIGELNDSLTTFDLTITFGSEASAQEVGDYSTINTSALYKSDAACSGDMIERNCTFRLATIRYPVTVTNGIATLEEWRMGKNETIGITQFPNASSIAGNGTLFTGTTGGGQFMTMLGGIFYVLKALYAANTGFTLIDQINTSYDLFTTGQASSNYLSSDISTYSNCSMTWDDPTTDIVNTARQLMFRSAVAYSDSSDSPPSSTIPQKLMVQQTKVAAAYKTHYEYLAITVACMVLQALLILFLLLGFHRLGRHLSTDGFEIARALGAPLLQGGSSNNSMEEALEPVKKLQVRYGEILPDDQGNRRHVPYQPVHVTHGSDVELHSNLPARVGRFQEGAVHEARPCGGNTSRRHTAWCFILGLRLVDVP